MRSLVCVYAILNIEGGAREISIEKFSDKKLSLIDP